METRTIRGLGVLAAGITLLITGASSKNALPAKPDATSKGSDGSRVSFSPGVYSTMAMELFAAMDKVFVDKATIFRIMESLRTVADLEKLMFVYGTRVKTSFLVFSYQYNLVQWLKDSLKGHDLERVRLVFGKFNIPF